MSDAREYAVSDHIHMYGWNRGWRGSSNQYLNSVLVLVEWLGEWQAQYLYVNAHYDMVADCQP
jgi:hypothetical protein